VSERVTTAALQRMKREGRKIVAVVVYDYQTAQIVDRAGVDLVSVGDSVGMTLWGQQDEADVTLGEMLLACRAVRRGVRRALVSCDVPAAAANGGSDAAVLAAKTLVTDGGADMVKLDAPAETVRAVVAVGIPTWAQLSVVRLKPDTTIDTNGCIEHARGLEAAGASMLDFRHSGPDAGPAVVSAVSIPVLGGLGGGPWLDGRVRAIGNAIGNVAAALDDHADRYANVARLTLDAITAYAADVRGGRQIKGS
jgi:3-methyl-2-oxobutanoate hydroxymethyltransferase